jgi:hypothetical protein
MPQAVVGFRVSEAVTGDGPTPATNSGHCWSENDPRLAEAVGAP